MVAPPPIFFTFRRPCAPLVPATLCGAAGPLPHWFHQSCRGQLVLICIKVTLYLFSIRHVNMYLEKTNVKVGQMSRTNDVDFVSSYLVRRPIEGHIKNQSTYIFGI